MKLRYRALFWLAFAIAGLVGVVAICFALPAWTLQSGMSKLGYRDKATAQQVAYGRKWCASHHFTRLASIVVTYALVFEKESNVAATPTRFSPALDIRCAYGSERLRGVEYMGRLYISKPDEVPSI